MDLSAALNVKQFYRFTGPPEHWLTAIKFMTWGLEEPHRKRWQKIQTGDVFFIHSTGPNKDSIFPNAKSGIIGIGVVGFHFSTKENHLWHYELRHNVNRWPLLIPLTEIYLFSELPDPSTWESPTPSNNNQTIKLIDKLVKNRIPISEIGGFPQMGSFSAVSRNVAHEILSKNKELYLYSGHSLRGSKFPEMKSDFFEVKNATETLRHAASLRFLDQISKRIITKPYSLVQRDNDILARAETVHHSILENLIDLFKGSGFTTFSTPTVDLFAHNEKRSFLVEAKSTENYNFRSQARKGIVQLLENDFFEIRKYKKDHDISFQDEYRMLALSRTPSDKNYVQFINSCNLGVGVVDSKHIEPVGKDFGFSII